MINLDFYKTGDGTKQFWGASNQETLSIIYNSLAAVRSDNCKTLALRNQTKSRTEMNRDFQ